MVLRVSSFLFYEKVCSVFVIEKRPEFVEINTVLFLLEHPDQMKLEALHFLHSLTFSLFTSSWFCSSYLASSFDPWTVKISQWTKLTQKTKNQSCWIFDHPNKISQNNRYIWWIQELFRRFFGHFRGDRCWRKTF